MNRMARFQNAVWSIVIVMLIFTVTGMARVAEASVADWQQGATIFPKSTQWYATAEYRKTVDDLVALGANYVGLQVEFYQRTLTSSTLSSGWNSVTEQTLREGIRYAHQKGLKVFVINHVLVDTNEWHANIDPTNRDAWFLNYTNAVVNTGRIAQEEGVELMSLGVELYKVASEVANPDNTQRWKKLIAEVRKVYRGQLTYGAQHTGDRSEKLELGFASDLDYIGLSAYFPLYIDQNASVSQQVDNLVRTWGWVEENYIRPVYAKYGKPVLFTEGGYRNIDDSYTDPYNSWSVRPFNEIDQRDAYEALFQFWDTIPYMAGWHIWAFEALANSGGPTDNTYTPQGKAAEAVVAKWFGSSTVTNPPNPTSTPASSFKAAINWNTPVIAPQNTATATINFIAGTKLENANVSFELFENDGTRVFQKYEKNVSLPQGGTAVFRKPFTLSQSGLYHLDIGVFDANWGGLAWLTDPQKSLTVNGGGTTTQPPTATTTATSTPPTTSTFPAAYQTQLTLSSEAVQVGDSVTLTAKTTGPNNGLVHYTLELFNDQYQKVAQFKDTNVQSTVGGHTQQVTWVPTIPGQYHVGVGVFSQSWNGLWWDTLLSKLVKVE
jgi:hypothetical protein